MNKRCFVFIGWTSMLVHRGECDLMFWVRGSCPLLSPGLRFEPATSQSQTWLQSPKAARSSSWWNVSSHAGFHADDDPLWRKTADYWNSCYTFMTELSSSSFKHDYSCLNYHNINVWHSMVFHRSSCESSEITFSVISIRQNCEITNYAKLNVHFAFSQINCAALWQTICIMFGIHQKPAMYSWARTTGWHGSEPDSWQDIGKISQLSLAAWQRRGGGARHNRKGNCNMWNCGRCVSIYILMRIRLETIVSGCNEKVISKAILVQTDVSGNFILLPNLSIKRVKACSLWIKVQNDVCSFILSVICCVLLLQRLFKQWTLQYLLPVSLNPTLLWLVGSHRPEQACRGRVETV